MTHVILITKEDINLSAMGTHYDLNCQGDLVINFTKEALTELITNYYQILGNTHDNK